MTTKTKEQTIDADEKVKADALYELQGECREIIQFMEQLTKRLRKQPNYINPEIKDLEIRTRKFKEIVK